MSLGLSSVEHVSSIPNRLNSRVACQLTTQRTTRSQSQQATTATATTIAKNNLLGIALEVLLKERLASHLLGLGQAHGSQDRGGDVAQDTVARLEAPALGGVGHDEGHLVGGVAGLGLTVGELHLLGVAVVRGDEEDVALLLAAIEDLANGLVGGRAADNGSLVHAGVANHVRGGKVVHDEGELLLGETLDNLVGNAIGGHLGGEVVGGDRLVGGDKILGLVSGLKREDLLNTAVEEEGDVSVLLSLGNVDLLHVLLAQPLGQDVAHALGCEGNLEGVVSLVRGHGDQPVELGEGEVGEDGLVDTAKDLGDLADTVRSVVEEEDNVVIYKHLSAHIEHELNSEELTLDTALLTANNNGCQELILVLATAELISSLDSGNRVFSGLALTQDHTLQGKLDSLPALITVHGVVAANDGGNLAKANLGKSLDKLLHVGSAGLGVGVTAIAEEVDEDLGNAVLLGSLDEGVEVGLFRVLFGGVSGMFRWKDDIGAGVHLRHRRGRRDRTDAIGHCQRQQPRRSS